MKNQALYTIFFEDGSNFVGGTSYSETKWLDIPNKKINRIFYHLPDGNYLCLTGYDKYYHMVEVAKDLVRIQNNQVEKLTSHPRIEYVYIMGKKGTKVTSYRIVLLNKPNDRYKLGDITRREYNIKHEKIKELYLEAWK